jgi:hypothetical protein
MAPLDCGNWLLSFGYRTYQQRSQTEREIAKRRTALTLEIQNRLSPADMLTDSSQILTYLKALEIEPPRAWALGEYKERTFMSLLWELEGLDSAVPLVRSFQDIGKELNERNLDQDNLGKIKVFCFYWSQVSNYKFHGALAAPVGIETTDGVVRPLSRGDLNKTLQ